MLDRTDRMQLAVTVPHLLKALVDFIIGHTCSSNARQVTLDIHQQNRNTGIAESFCQYLKCFCFPGTCCTCYKTMTIHGLQRHQNRRTLHCLSIKHRNSQLKMFPLELVSQDHLFFECSQFCHIRSYLNGS
jgi:hypothetical protein